MRFNITMFKFPCFRAHKTPSTFTVTSTRKNRPGCFGTYDGKNVDQDCVMLGDNCQRCRWCNRPMGDLLFIFDPSLEICPSRTSSLMQD